MQQLTQLYKEFFGQEPAKVKRLSGAGSNRQYFRLWHSLGPDAGSVIGVIGENQKENHAFLSLAKHMFDQGLSVPRVFITTDDEMRYLQQDLGNTSLYDIISKPEQKEEGDKLLKQVMRALPAIQFKTAEGFDFKSNCCREPRFCGTTIRWDLNLDYMRNQLNTMAFYGIRDDINTVNVEDYVDLTYFNNCGAIDFVTFIEENIDPVFPEGMDYDSFKAKALAIDGVAAEDVPEYVERDR